MPTPNSLKRIAIGENLKAGDQKHELRSGSPTRAIPPLATIRAFEAVGRLGGIRRAAKSLQVDHSVVSRHLRQLEDWVGASLVQRVGHNINLTEVGACYHGRVSAALAELSLATAEIKSRDGQKRILVWCVPGFAAQWMTDRIGSFERARPGYSVELRPTDVPADLLTHEADVDVRFYLDESSPEPGGKGIQYIELARPPIMIVASPSVAGHYRGVSVEDLVTAPLLHEDHDKQWRCWLSLNNVQDLPDLLPGPLLWHAHLAIAAARSGRGLALASAHLVDADLRSGSLVEVQIARAKPVVIGAYVFATRADRWSCDAVLQFRRFLQAEVSKFSKIGAPTHVTKPATIVRPMHLASTRP